MRLIFCEIVLRVKMKTVKKRESRSRMARERMMVLRMMMKVEKRIKINYLLTLTSEIDDGPAHDHRMLETKQRGLQEGQGEGRRFLHDNPRD